MVGSCGPETSPGWQGWLQADPRIREDDEEREASRRKLAGTNSHKSFRLQYRVIPVVNVFTYKKVRNPEPPLVF